MRGQLTQTDLLVGRIDYPLQELVDIRARRGRGLKDRLLATELIDRYSVPNRVLRNPGRLLDPHARAGEEVNTLHDVLDEQGDGALHPLELVRYAHPERAVCRLRPLEPDDRNIILGVLAAVERAALDAHRPFAVPRARRGRERPRVNRADEGLLAHVSLLAAPRARGRFYLVLEFRVERF